MSSIGPQLPTSPSQRKRTSYTEARSSSSPSQAARNNDEIALDSESDDDYGPSAPKPSVGPTLPPSTTSQNANEIPLESEDDDDFGPSAPPPAAAASAPAPASSSSSDSEDDYGPSLPSAAQKPTIGPSLPPSEDPATQHSASDAPIRDDWMLAPPVSTGYQERDPTKLRARKFASKPSSSSASSSKPGEIASIWTETPEQKLERLRNSVLGRSEAQPAAHPAPRRPSPPPAPPAEGGAKRRKLGDRDAQEETAAEGASRKGRKRGFERRPGEEDDPSKRGFDREKDMAIGGALSGKQKNEFLSQAKNFGGRFTKGSSMR